MPSQDHIHTYQRISDRPDYYRCIHPTCTSFTKKSLLVGKLGLCPNCQAEFVLSREKLKRVRPLCDNCSNTKAAREKRRIAQIPEVTDLLAQIQTENEEPKEPNGEGSLT